MNKVPRLGVEAPARQGAKSALTGRKQAMSNAARRDASAASLGTLFMSRPLACRAASRNWSPSLHVDHDAIDAAAHANAEAAATTRHGLST